jgi:hypothetical protein
VRHIAIRGIFAALFLTVSFCAFADKPNLCTEHEDTYFICTLKNGKLVSVCGTEDVSDKSGYLVYRFGTKQKIEISLPGKPLDFRRVSSTIALTNDEPIEDDEFIRFMNGKFSYIIYSAIGNNFEVDGLAVFDEYKLLNHAECLPDSIDTSLVQNFLLNAGVQSEDPDEAMRFWKPLLPSNSAALSQKSSNRPKK